MKRKRTPSPPSRNKRRKLEDNVRIHNERRLKQIEFPQRRTREFESRRVQMELDQQVAIVVQSELEESRRMESQRQIELDHQVAMRIQQNDTQLELEELERNETQRLIELDHLIAIRFQAEEANVSPTQNNQEEENENHEDLESRDITSEDYNDLVSLDRNNKKKGVLTGENFRKIPKLVYVDIPSDGVLGKGCDKCVICYSNFIEDGIQELSILNCGHVFCTGCIRRWLCTEKAACPHCKKEVVVKRN